MSLEQTANRSGNLRQIQLAAQESGVILKSNGYKFLKGAGNVLGIIGVLPSALNFAYDRTYGNWGRFVVSAGTFGVGFIPGVGPFLSIGVGIADYAGAFDSFYGWLDDNEIFLCEIPQDLSILD